MNFIKRWFRRFWYLIWYLFAALVVFMAAVFGLARLLLPLVDDYNQDIEHYAARLVDRPIKIMSLDAEWHGFSPSLVLNNVRLLSKDGSQTLLDLSRARLDFDLIGMVRNRNVQFKRFALSGANLSIVRRETGEVSLSGFESSQIETPADDEKGAVVQWLLSQGEISLHANNLIYHDRKAGKKRYHLSNVILDLRNRGDRHLIDGAIGFPEQAGQEFLFSMDITGDITTGSQWSGSVYVGATNLDIEKLIGSLGSRGHRVSIGKSNFEIWSEWRNAALTGMQGDLSLENVREETGKQFTPLLQTLLPDMNDKAVVTKVADSSNKILIDYDNIIGRFMWNKYTEGWQLAVDRFVLSRNKRVWPTSQFSMHYFNDETSGQQFDLRAGIIRVEDVAPLLPILIGDYQNYSGLVEQLSPRGDVKDIDVRWQGSDNQYTVAARVKDIAFAPVKKLPGFEGLSGELHVENNNGSITLDTSDGEFSYPRMFRWNIPVKQLQGKLEWNNSNDTLQVSSRNLVLDTAHFKSKAVLDLQVPKQKGSPFISLIMKFRDGDGSKASYYYPVSIMKDKTVKWLDAAIVQGDVTSGGAIIYGPLDRFPFTGGQGVFDVRFSVQNAILDYAEDWPQIHNAQAEVVFRGNSLSVTSNKANIFSSSLSNVRVAIDNLHKKPLQLNIAGRVSGKSQEKLNYLMVSPPLNRMYGQYLGDLKASGESDLDLDINLLIADDVHSVVKGDLRLKDNGLEMQAIPDMLSKLNGELKITNKGLSARNMQAELLGQPGKLSVRTNGAGAGLVKGDIVVTAVGRFDARELSEQRFPVMKDLVNGKSPWRVTLTVPGGDDTKRNRNLHLSMYSKLQGVAVNLPPPFAKQKSDSRVLKVSMDFNDMQRLLLKTSYAGTFEGIFDCDTTKPFWVSRGEVRFGGGPVVLPGTKGLRIAGNMEELSVDIWKSLIEQVVDQFAKNDQDRNIAAAQPEKQSVHMALIHSVDLLVKKFEIFGQQATDMRLKIENKGHWLAAEIDSKEMKGSVIVPANLQKDSIELDMQHMRLKSVESGGQKIDPRQLPSIIFNSRSLVYDNKKLGKVAFETAKANNGLLLEQVIFNPRSTTVKGHGYWTVEQGQDKSMLEFVLDSDDLGRTMRDLGYVDTIADGKGRITAKLSWPGAIIDPNLQHISGDVELDFKNGRVLDIEPGGAARLFGLFSLQTLPRRLTLDFSDLFGKGLGFDSVHGQFRIEDGDAYTNDFSMKGPSADVSLRGRIGIGSQDYDQKIRVTPHITDTAILLSIITSQPLLFFFQQLLKEDFDKAASFEYTLTGSWTNYKLEPVLKRPPPPPETDEF